MSGRVFHDDKSFMFIFVASSREKCAELPALTTPQSWQVDSAASLQHETVGKHRCLESASRWRLEYYRTVSQCGTGCGEG